MTKPNLEDGDRVVADHVRPRERLGEEKENEKSHWKEDCPGEGCDGECKNPHLGKQKYPSNGKNGETF